MNYFASVLTLSLVAVQGELSSLPRDYWRNPERCGLNCLYAYLSIHGKEHDLEEIAGRVKLGPKGANFDDMQRAATDMGVPSSVVKLTNAELSRVPLPAIAHLDVRGGHYRLLLVVNPATVTTADMSSGEINEVPRNEFLETWSGYLLVSGRAFEWRRILPRALALTLIGFGVICWLNILRHRNV